MQLFSFNDQVSATFSGNRVSTHDPPAAYSVVPAQLIGRLYRGPSRRHWGRFTRQSTPRIIIQSRSRSGSRNSASSDSLASISGLDLPPSIGPVSVLKLSRTASCCEPFALISGRFSAAGFVGHGRT